MKVSLKWLQTMVEVPKDLDAFVEKLDLTGTAVDSVHYTGARFEDIFVGQILVKEQHPNADSLWVTSVDVGENNLGEDGKPKPLQIVCGAQNFAQGDKVVVALEGAELPGGIKIKKTKLRGVESRGMNCSNRELGLGTDHEGIMVLPADAPVGIAFSDYAATGDTILDLEITTNRPDCMSMLGVAREVAAIYTTSYDLGRAMPEPPTQGKAEDFVRVSIDESTRCARYTARIIKGITVGPSPEWLAERITAAGARPINNIVDATNYIMFETGQPLHAFDLDTLAKDAEGKASIIVRAAGQGEKFTTLDEVERTLSTDATVIVDGNAASGTGASIALAGVMGGLESEVTDKTVNILLESASFNQGHTSRTSRNLKLLSESSSRFDKGVDDATCDEFSARAAALM
ncbi:MAG: phenylalanine--tRNA ligase subunit beta, partial [Coriobacteriia bacterium]|nr:phenylalanine--tRNA ligase subunit beta [Coriobacteriia bacterium]